MEKNKNISKRLSEVIEKFKLNPYKLSKMAGGTTTKYYKILSGDAMPNYETIYEILDKMPDVSESWLIFGYGQMLKSESEKITKNEKSELSIMQERLKHYQTENQLMKMLLKEKGIEI